MTEQWSVPAWVAVALCAALVLLAGLAVALAFRGRTRTAREVSAARAETAQLRARVEELAAAAPAAQVRTEQEFVITRLGEQEALPAPAPAVAGPLFADLVLRESVVKAASLAAGVRRALAPQTRNRIRFEMRREVKRSRKQRRVDTKAALRAWRARERDTLDEGTAA